MRILITGATGFVGGYLADYVLQMKKHQVWGIRRRQSDLSRIRQMAPGIRWVQCDITDAVGVKKALRIIRPDRIFHLAAQSYVPSSWRDPSETLMDNLLGEMNLLEAVRGLKPGCRILIVGSSEEYGLVKKSELPVKETNAFRPLSPYAVSKIGQDLLAYQYFKTYKLHLIRTRAFNHEGPRRPPMFASSGFARQIALIEAGKQKPVISVGNLNVIRDFTDVRDIVRAYWMALEKCVPGEVYNICSGKGWSIRRILRTLMDYSNRRISCKVDPDRLRPADVPILIGDSRKFTRATGWKPQIPFEQTLQDLLDYWREQIRCAPSESAFR